MLCGPLSFLRACVIHSVPSVTPLLLSSFIFPNTIPESICWANVIGKLISQSLEKTLIAFISIFLHLLLVECGNWKSYSTCILNIRSWPLAVLVKCSILASYNSLSSPSVSFCWKFVSALASALHSYYTIMQPIDCSFLKSKIRGRSSNLSRGVI